MNIPGIVYHPRAVHVRIASNCNLACNFCERELLGAGKPKKGGVIFYADGRPPIDLSRDMDLAAWEAVKKHLMPFTDNMELGGLGEPTMSKIFVQAARDIIDAGKHLFFFTNGHTLGSDKVINALRGGKLRISISLDAGTVEGYKRIRGGDLDNVVANVKRFKKAIPEAVLCSQFTATADNIDELPAFVRLCAELGIGQFADGGEIVVAGAHHHVTDRAEKSVRFVARRAMKALDEAITIAQQNRLWLMSVLPPMSEANANAIDDGSDPTKIRRYGDRLLGDLVCSVGASSIVPSGSGGGGALGAMRSPEGKVIMLAPQQMYVDLTGDVWTCLARHKIGVIEDGWDKLVTSNDWYQNHLAYFAGAVDAPVPEVCQKCPNLA